jgi:hypothetical protein
MNINVKKSVLIDQVCALGTITTVGPGNVVKILQEDALARKISKLYSKAEKLLVSQKSYHQF